MENSTKTILVVSAHAADFVWRAGGAIALYASRGYKVRILCLSYGERGESQAAWKQPGMTIERVKEIRRAESTRAKLPWKWRALATNAAPRKSVRAPG
jgi:4-oxalomesaconate hydratase